MDDAAIHGISRDADGLSLRLLVHSGSPRAFSPRDDKILYAGATLAGMALLGCRPIGPGPPRSAWLYASAVILPYIAPLLLLLETNTEANVERAVARGVGVAHS
jgi:hypothetical protein